MKKKLSKKHQARADILRGLGESTTSTQLGEILGVNPASVRRWWTGAVKINDLTWRGIEAKLKEAGYEI